MSVILILIGCLALVVVLLSAYSNHYGFGDVKVQFRTPSGAVVRTGRGGSIGKAMADGFISLYDSLSPSSRSDVIESRLGTMIEALEENRRRMQPQDIALCEKYIDLTRELLEKRIADLTDRRKFADEQRRLMSAKLRYDVLQRDGFRCQICGATAADGAQLHVDHIIPVSKGGRTELSNLRTLCDRCNLGKGSRLEQPMKK